jgi:uncharacterized protein (TIGR03435 family)
MQSNNFREDYNMSGKSNPCRSATCLYAAVILFAFAGTMAAGQDPDAGTELSKTAGVSLLREPAGQNSSWLKQSQANMGGVIVTSFSCGGRTLAEVVEHVSGVPKSLVVGAAVLPEGTYTVRITAARESEIKSRLFRGLESAFGVRVSEKKRKLEALVLKKGASWSKSGLKPAKVEEGLDTASGDGTNLTFDGVDMNWLAGQLALALGKPVLNETRIKGRFQGTLPIGGKGSMRDVEKALGRHGLLLQAATRDVRVVVVERKEK